MKNILIIGASSGIGAKITDLLSENVNIYGTYHKNERENKGSVKYHKLNIEDEIPDMDFLPDTLDGLIYCPGSINLKPFSTIKPDDFVKDYNLQVIGAIKIIQKVFPLLKKSKSASIILFSTVAVQNGFSNHAQISASKGALEGLTRALSAEFAPGIRVNCTAPGLIDTPLTASLLNTDEKKSQYAKKHPMQKIGSTADIAHMAAFLLDEKSGWITGQIFHVDGGIDAIKM